jgi:hypothetical protein
MVSGIDIIDYWLLLGYLTPLFQLRKVQLMASNGRMSVNDVLEWMWEEEVVVYFKVLTQYLREGSKKHSEKPQAVHPGYGPRVKPETSRMQSIRL